MTVLAIALAALFLVAGAAHAVVPRYFVGLVPEWIPAPRVMVAVSGVADVLAGVLLTIPATRQAGAGLAAVLVAIYLVSHVDGFCRRDVAGPLLLRPWVTVLRLVVNVGYLVAAIVVAADH